jgi:hypothetical protein
MTGALEPVQPELPLDFEKKKQAEPGPAPDLPAEVSPTWQKPPEVLPPSIYQQAMARVRSLPWAHWRSRAQPLLRTGAAQLQTSAAQLAGMARIAVSRGAPYTATLARRTANLSLFRLLALQIAKAIHLAGLPAVVTRTAIQHALAHRAGLVIDEVVFFRLDDPAGYTVYEAPPRLNTALAIAYIPALILAVLSLICLAPVALPHSVLHLPITWLTWLEVWLGLSFAAHALPAYEEAGPVAEQVRIGMRQADPLALITFLPTQLVAWLGRLGGVLPAIAGSLILWWLAGIVLIRF